MFNTALDAVAFSLKKSQLMLHRFLDSLKPEEFEQQPILGVNSISWILGHLILTDRRQLMWLGVEPLPAFPVWFQEDHFKTTRTTAIAQSHLGDSQGLLALFDAHRNALIECLPSVPPARFLEPPSFETPMFADRGEGSLFMGLHTSMHMGQISVIRRALGYPPVS
jgi:uncharacterized damage-inducible protein DinB